MWEPAPLQCTPENRDEHLRACKFVDVFSPNHVELLRIFGHENQDSSLSRGAIETYAERCLEAANEGSTSSASIVVRAGEHGAMTLSKATKCRWFPPFHDPQPASIVDTTGAGNAFLGAFTIGLQIAGELAEAAAYGAVAASFAVEQIGLPGREAGDSGESWNGATFATRLREYNARVVEEVGS